VTPVTTLGGPLAPMLGHDAQTTTRALSAMVGRQLPIFSLAIPAYLVVLYAGWRRMVEVWPAALVAGAPFAIGQFTVSNFVGPELTDALSALISLTSVALLLRVWQPAEQFTEGARAAVGPVTAPRPPPRRPRPTPPRRPRLRDLRGADRDRADRTDRQLRRHVEPAAAGQRDRVAQMRPGRQQAVPGRVGGDERSDRSAGVPLPGVGIPLARRLPDAGWQADAAGAARGAGGRHVERVRVDLSSRLPRRRRHAGVSRRVDRVRADAAVRGAARRAGDRVRQDPAPAAAARDHHRVHPLDRDGDELLGDDLVDGARAREDRRDVSV